jgi:putative flippase GtrA
MLVMLTRIRRNIDELRVSVPAKFVISGALNTAVTYVLFLVLTLFLATSIAYTLTYVVGIAIAYLLNALFVFRTGNSKRMAIAVPVSYFIQYFYGLAALKILMQVFRLPPYITMAVVIASSFPLQFLLLRFSARGSIIQRKEQ